MLSAFPLQHNDRPVTWSELRKGGGEQGGTSTWGCLCRIPALGSLDHSRMLSVASSIAFSGMFQCGGAVLDAQGEW